ncbi:peptidase M20 [Collibacillus ludicampi]|uniref:Peptidase M20 n=1 Tax=Collibacillus ludicampi TaxID=2771369 RepID=A0AAV4LDR5_9BACL|nr:dipeptidase [Collibacillus ludicampi]GIM45866.1 peptidase M20 [Collibacillus ludicampi]
MDPRIEEYLSENREHHLDELKQLLAIPSVSALPEHKQDIQRAAQWLAESLKRAGMEQVKVMPTKGNPVVYGEWLKAEGKPTVLIYGHYDVQPVDPLELWETPPFEPDIRDGQIFARGASDDKGQTFMHIKALETILRTTGSLRLNFKFCLEGEEEIGSPNLEEFVAEHKDLLAADVLVISDTSMLGRGKPAICYGLRGLCGLQIDVTGAKADLHSGLFGGAVQNPIHALVELLASMRNKDGQITINGFYDRVLPLTEEEKEAFRALNTDEEQTRKDLQVPDLFGEKGYTMVERTWARPTLEINGIYGGFQGEGIKTVIPSQAHAKITCRLVPDQDPEEILALIEEHVRTHTPPGVTVEVKRFDKGRPFITPIDHPAIQAAARAYEKVFGVTPAFTRMGGSIPIVETFDRLLHLPIVLMGFSYPDDNFHAPNEHFHLECFDNGLRTLCYYWYELEQAIG